MLQHTGASVRETGEAAGSIHTINVITLEGEWDLSRGDELRRRLERGAAHRDMVLDFSRLTYIDSTCIGALMRLRTQRVAKGWHAGQAILPSGHVLRILHICNFQELWSICESLDEALRSQTHSGNTDAAAGT